MPSHYFDSNELLIRPNRQLNHLRIDVLSQLPPKHDKITAKSKSSSLPMEVKRGCSGAAERCARENSRPISIEREPTLGSALKKRK